MPSEPLVALGVAAPFSPTSLYPSSARAAPSPADDGGTTVLDDEHLGELEVARGLSHGDEHLPLCSSLRLSASRSNVVWSWTASFPPSSAPRAGTS